MIQSKSPILLSRCSINFDDLRIRQNSNNICAHAPYFGTLHFQMAEHSAHEIAQPGASFLHTCLLYSPLRKSTNNKAYIGFLPEKGPQQGGPLGAFKCGRQIQKYLLIIKDIGPMEFRHILDRALSDTRQGHVNGISAAQCAIQRLLDFDPLRSTNPYSDGREMSEIYVLTYENEFPDTLMVEQYEPGSCCAVL
jgi:hypothetical protein